jgi:hypothetical protein
LNEIMRVAAAQAETATETQRSSITPGAVTIARAMAPVTVTMTTAVIAVSNHTERLAVALRSGRL